MPRPFLTGEAMGIKRNIYLSQEVAARHFPGLKMKALAVLDWYHTFVHTGQMKAKVHDGRVYYWVHYPTILKQMPLLEWKTTDPVYRAIRKLVEFGLLVAHPDNVKDSESYYGLGENFALFVETGTSKHPVENTGLTPLKKPGLPRLKNRADKYIKYKGVINTLKEAGLPDDEIYDLFDYLAGKKLVKQAGDVIKVIDHFNRTHGRALTYWNRTYLAYITKRLAEGHSADDICLVIDYKLYYFTEVLPKPENKELDTYLRDRAFPGNLDKARAWAARQAAHPEEFTKETWEKSSNESYRRFMAWYWRAEELRSYPITQAEFEDFLAGKVSCPPVEKAQENARKHMLLDAVNEIVKKGKLPYGGRTMMEQIIHFLTIMQTT